jgi:hypothetical protein
LAIILTARASAPRGSTLRSLVAERPGSSFCAGSDGSVSGIASLADFF